MVILKYFEKVQQLFYCFILHCDDV